MSRALLLPLFAAAALGPPAAVQGSAVGVPGSAAGVSAPAGGFENALRQSELLMGVRKWRRARTTLLQALERHAGEEVVLEHLDDVLDDIKRCSFWMQTTRPRPQDVLSGELVDHDTYRNEVHVRYRLSEPGWGRDFESIEGLAVHPARFTGPISIEVRGHCTAEDGHFQVLTNVGTEDHYGVIFGRRTGVLAVRDGEPHILEQVDVDLPVGEAYRVEVRVESSTIAVLLNGQTLLRASKPRGAFGQFAFGDLGTSEMLEVQGRIEPSWIEGRVDAVVRARWEEFERGWDPERDLPAWLLELWRTQGETGEDGNGAADDTLPSPDTAHPDDARHLAHARALHDAERIDDGLSWARSLAEADASQPMRDWLLAYFLDARGESVAALHACDRVVAADPTWFPARGLRADLLAAMVSRSAGLAEYRLLIDEFPDEPDAYAGLAELHLLAGDPELAKAVLDSARGARVRSQWLTALSSVLVRALKGPRWQTVHEYRSRNYHVVSDISQQLCFEAAQVLEASHRKFSRTLAPLPDRRGERFRVYLFSGQKGYLDYAEDLIGGAPHFTAGMYSPALGQLLVWNLPERESMMQTLRHESLHQYLDALVEDPPMWLNEGLAEYFERSALVRGYWNDGALHPEHVAFLHSTRTRLAPLEELFFLDEGGFYADPSLHYAESWMLVHFLLHGGSPERKLLDALLERLIAGEEANEAILAVFSDVDLLALQAEFGAYIDSKR